MMKKSENIMSLKRNDKYYLVNEKSKSFFYNEIEALLKCRKLEKIHIDRIYEEIEILYKKRILFILMYLYLFKKKEDILFRFRGTINNLLFMYIIGLSEVNPLEYNLPKELFVDKNINIVIINFNNRKMVGFLKNLALKDDLKLVKYNFCKTEDSFINDFESNKFVFISSDNIDIADLTIKIDQEVIDKSLSFEELIIKNDFERKMIDKLKPSKLIDYARIKALGHGSMLWSYNQEELSEKVKLNDLITCREDIFNYLVKHSIKDNVCLDIITYICNSHKYNDQELWDKYISLIINHSCDKKFIDIISNTLFVKGLGEFIGECLSVKNNI